MGQLLKTEILKREFKKMAGIVAHHTGVVWCLPANKSGHIGLTFDDGPHPIMTPKILDVLSRCHVRATFFLVGSKVDRYPDIVQRILHDGHDIGGHSYSHANLAELNKARVDEELDRTKRCIHQASQIKLCLFRPPFGAINWRVIRAVSRHGLTLILWSIDSLDFELTRPQDVVERIEQHGPRAGDIVLLHDTYAVTVKALPEIIERIHANGLQFTSVSTLLSASTKTATNRHS